MRGSIRRRSRRSFEIRLDIARDPATGKRTVVQRTVKGTKRDAGGLLAQLLAQYENGMLVTSSDTTVADYMRAWLKGNRELAGKTRERYGDFIEAQIAPFIGHETLQK